MYKFLLISAFLFLSNICFAQFLDTDSPRYQQQTRNPNSLKTSGKQLKQSGYCMLSALGLATIGMGVSYFGHKAVNNKYDTEMNDATLPDLHATDRENGHKTVNGISYTFIGGAVVFNVIAIGKIISAGSLLEAEIQEAKKKTSFNITSNGFNLAYRF